MRAIYCYKQIKNHHGIHNHYKPLNDEFFKLAKKSIESVSKYYKTIFYTDTESYDLFTKRGLKFDEVVILDILEHSKIQSYGLPKIYTMMNQYEPYILLDFDTIITSKLESEYEITYAYYEMDFTKHFRSSNVRWILESYIEPFNNVLIKYYEKDFVNNFDWRRYPNTSTLMVKIPKFVRDSYNDLLNRVPLDVIESVPPTLHEQFLLQQYVINNSITYGTFLDGYTDINNIKKEKIYHINTNEINCDNIFKIIDEL
jgi:hypothetical protein